MSVCLRVVTGIKKDRNAFRIHNRKFIKNDKSKHRKRGSQAFKFFSIPETFHQTKLRHTTQLSISITRWFHTKVVSSLTDRTPNHVWLDASSKNITHMALVLSNRFSHSQFSPQIGSLGSNHQLLMNKLHRRSTSHCCWVEKWPEKLRKACFGGWEKNWEDWNRQSDE